MITLSGGESVSPDHIYPSKQHSQTTREIGTISSNAYGGGGGGGGAQPPVMQRRRTMDAVSGAPMQVIPQTKKFQDTVERFFGRVLKKNKQRLTLEQFRNYMDRLADKLKKWTKLNKFTTKKHKNSLCPITKAFLTILFVFLFCFSHIWQVLSENHEIWMKKNIVKNL